MQSCCLSVFTQQPESASKIARPQNLQVVAFMADHRISERTYREFIAASRAAPQPGFCRQVLQEIKIAAPHILELSNQLTQALCIKGCRVHPVVPFET